MNSKTQYQYPNLAGSFLTHSPDKAKTNTRKRTTLPPLDDTYSYIVFADNLDSSHKLDLTKIDNIRGIFTSEDHAKEFAKQYGNNEGKVNFTSLIFKIKNGEKLNIRDDPLVVYCKTAYQSLFNYDTPSINKTEYHKYIKYKETHWFTSCFCRR